MESLPNKITDKPGVLVGIKAYEAAQGTNLRYGVGVPGRVAAKLINQYACGRLTASEVEAGDRRYAALSALERDNPVRVSGNGTMDYFEISVPRYPFAISCEGKYDKRSGPTLRELNGFALQNFLLERAGKTWDAVPLPGVGVEDLSREAIDAFRSKAVAKKRITRREAEAPDEVLLHDLKLFDNGQLARAAILMFHPGPEQGG